MGPLRQPGRCALAERNNKKERANKQKCLDKTNTIVYNNGTNTIRGGNET